METTGTRPAGAESIDGRTENQGSSPLFFFERWLIKRILESKGRPPVRVVFWNGQAFGATKDEAVATVHVKDRRALYAMARGAELGFGEGYTRGDLEVEGDLLEFMTAIYSTAGTRGTLEHRLAGWLNRRNSLRGSKANIHHHYDLGNDFYSWWLDEKMLYTCAYFPTPDATLEAAQIAKMDFVGKKLRLRPGETVAEAGCGWGGLALHLAGHFGVKVRAFNISHQQILWAREQARSRGLDSQVEFVEDDYRNISGKYDAFVSVGMLEHVGKEHYRDLGGVIDRVLSPEGRGFIHTIGRARNLPLSPWIVKHIFPGAYPPTLKEMMEIFEPYDFKVIDVENLRAHYARTLEHWLERYERSVDKVKQRYDEDFSRAWRLYLSGSTAAFRAGNLQLFQVLFSRHAYEEAWTREHLFAADRLSNVG